MNRSIFTKLLLPFASLLFVSSTACSAPASDDDPASAEAAVESSGDIRVTFVGCAPEFSGKGVASGVLPHDGITKCSQDDGVYNTNKGYRLDLLRGGSGSDAARTITGESWFEDRGDVVLSISADQLAEAEGLKVWFGGHSDWMPLAELPKGNAITCSVKLVGRWVEAEGAYAKHAEFACEGSAPSGGSRASGASCSATSQCASALTCGVTYRCIDGCLGSGQPRDAAEACANACPTVCRPDFLP